MGSIYPAALEQFLHLKFAAASAVSPWTFDADLIAPSYKNPKKNQTFHFHFLYIYIFMTSARSFHCLHPTDMYIYIYFLFDLVNDTVGQSQQSAQLQLTAMYTIQRLYSQWRSWLVLLLLLLLLLRLFLKLLLLLLVVIVVASWK